jgi:hypothetical protein
MAYRLRLLVVVVKAELAPLFRHVRVVVEAALLVMVETAQAAVRLVVCRELPVALTESRARVPAARRMVRAENPASTAAAQAVEKRLPARQVRRAVARYGADPEGVQVVAYWSAIPPELAAQAAYHRHTEQLVVADRQVQRAIPMLVREVLEALAHQAVLNSQARVVEAAEHATLRPRRIAVRAEREDREDHREREAVVGAQLQLMAAQRLPDRAGLAQTATSLSSPYENYLKVQRHLACASCWCAC